MRALSSVVINRLEANSMDIFYIVQVSSAADTFNHTTARMDITIPDFNVVGTPVTFLKDNGLLKIEPPRLTSVVDREAYKILYSDPLFAFRSKFETGLTGASVIVYFGFFNTTNTTIVDSEGNSVLPGFPILSKKDLFLSYSGFVDTQGYTVNDQDGTVTAVIECASPMASLGLIKSIRTSMDSLRQYDALDTAFDQVYAGAKSVNYVWGKLK